MSELERLIEEQEKDDRPYQPPERHRGRNVLQYEAWDDHAPAGEVLDQLRVRGLWGAAEDEIGPGFDLGQRVVAARVQRVLRMLPERQQEVLARHYLGNESVAEMAREDGVSETAIRKRLRTAQRNFVRAMTVGPPDGWEVDVDEL